MYVPWCSGGTLVNVLRRFPRDVTRRILAGACDGSREPMKGPRFLYALAYLNQVSKFLHYNIQPSNILVHLDDIKGPTGVVGGLERILLRETCENARRKTQSWLGSGHFFTGRMWITGLHVASVQKKKGPDWDRSATEHRFNTATKLLF